MTTGSEAENDPLILHPLRSFARAAVTKHHRWGAPATEIHRLTVWRLKGQD